MRIHNFVIALILVISQHGYTKGSNSGAQKGSSSSASSNDPLNKGSTIRETVTPIAPNPNAAADAQSYIDQEAAYARSLDASNTRSLAPTGNGGGSGPVDMTGFKTTPQSSNPFAPVPESDFQKALNASDPTQNLETFSTKGTGPAPAPGPGPTPTTNSEPSSGSRDFDGPASSGDGTAAAGSGAAAATNAKIKAATPPPPIVKELPPACNGLVSPFAKNLKATCATVVEAATACTEKYATSANICSTDTNPNLLSTMTQIQAMMSAVQGSGLTDACSSFSKAMNIGKVGMAAYTTYCGVQQKLCDMGCGKALAAIESLTEMIATNLDLLKACASSTDPVAGACAKDIVTINGPIAAVLAKEKTPVNNTIAGKAKVCKVDMLSLMGMGLLNVLSLAQAKSVSDQCEKQTAAADAAKAAAESCTNVANKDRADCACTIAANKTLSYCATGLVDCGMAENSDKPLCICKANPRMKGCEGVSTSLATNSTLSSGNGGGLSTSRSPGSLNGTPTTAADATNLFPNKKGNGQDGVGSASGGGGASGAGLGGDSPGGGATDKAATAAASKDSANVIDSGGGGGGGGGRGFGSTYTSPEYRSKLKAFADKNGIGSRIAGSSWGDQVTATGGKSNFDKVKTRYQENKSTLLAK